MTARAKVYDTCAHPGCINRLRDTNVTNVCRDHMHSKYCSCLQCIGGEKPRWRVRTRAELVEMGLLPKQRIFV